MTKVFLLTHKDTFQIIYLMDVHIFIKSTSRNQDQGDWYDSLTILQKRF